MSKKKAFVIMSTVCGINYICGFIMGCLTQKMKDNVDIETERILKRYATPLNKEKSEEETP